MFEKVYCINLDKRTDRWEECQQEFAKIPWKVERFPGVDGGFNYSQLNCIKAASEFESSLILEDDVEFLDVESLHLSLADLPDDWDLVSLGANIPIHHHIKVSERLYRYENGWATQAVGYSRKMMKWIVENFDPAGVIYDEWLRVNVLKQFKCYIVKPMATTQRISFSDIQGKFTDYTQLFNDSQRMLV